MSSVRYARCRGQSVKNWQSFSHVIAAGILLLGLPLRATAQTPMQTSTQTPTQTPTTKSKPVEQPSQSTSQKSNADQNKNDKKTNAKGDGSIEAAPLSYPPVPVYILVPQDHFFLSHLSYAASFAYGGSGNASIDGSSLGVMGSIDYHWPSKDHKLDAGLYYRLTKGSAENTFLYENTGYLVTELYDVTAHSIGLLGRYRVFETLKYGGAYLHLGTGVSFSSSVISAKPKVVPADGDPDAPDVSQVAGAMKPVGTEVEVPFGIPLMIGAGWEYRMPGFAVTLDFGFAGSGINTNENIGGLYVGLSARLYHKKWVSRLEREAILDTLRKLAPKAAEENSNEKKSEDQKPSEQKVSELKPGQQKAPTQTNSKQESSGRAPRPR